MKTNPQQFQTENCGYLINQTETKPNQTSKIPFHTAMLLAAVAVVVI